MGGRKAGADSTAIIQAFMDLKEQFLSFDNGKTYPPKSHFIYTDIANKLNSTMTPNAVYTAFIKNRYNIKDTITKDRVIEEVLLINEPDEPIVISETSQISQNTDSDNTGQFTDNSMDTSRSIR